MIHALHLNDARMRLANAAGVVASSTGHAVADAKRLLVGDAALVEFRRHASAANNLFWHRLSMEALRSRHPTAETHADLAHAHLEELWRQLEQPSGEVLLAVPGAPDRDQLALLLGIVGQCAFDSVGLIDAGVAAAAASGATSDHVVHLDGLLHRTTVTHVAGEGARWQRVSVEDVPAMALAGLRDAVLGLIADRFVADTRFDPLHNADTEQQLFDQVVRLLSDELQGSDSRFELSYGTRSYTTTVDHRSLMERIAPRLEPLLDLLGRHVEARASSSILVTRDLYAAVPGLRAALEGRFPTHILEIPDSAPLDGTLANVDAIRCPPDAIRFASELPRSAPDAVAEPPTAVITSAPAQHPPQAAAPGQNATNAERVPTHLLVDDVAWPLNHSGVQLGGPGGIGPSHLETSLATVHHSEGRWTLVQLDSPSIDLVPGASHAIGGHQITLIRVVDD